MSELNKLKDGEIMLSEIEEQTQLWRRIDFLFSYAINRGILKPNPFLPTIIIPDVKFNL